MILAAIRLPLAAVTAAAMVAAAPQAPPAQTPPVVTVWKSPTCGCCGKWVAHLRANGFRVVTRDTGDVVAVRRAQGVPDALQSCHTARVGRYVVEGHVPADLIHQLLREQRDVVGIAVPGMPAHAPGMDLPKQHPYDVVVFDRQGRTQVLATR